MAAFLCTDAWVGAGCVNEGQDRHGELGRQLHQAQRLAVTFGVTHTEIAMQLLLRIAALLLADHHQWATLEARQAADHRRVVGEAPVTVQFHEIGAEHLDPVQRIRPLRMAGEQHMGPGVRHRCTARLPQRLQLMAHSLDFLLRGG